MARDADSRYSREGHVIVTAPKRRGRSTAFTFVPVLAVAVESGASGGTVSWVAVAGVVLALVSLSWQVFNALRQRPRISVIRRTIVRASGTWTRAGEPPPPTPPRPPPGSTQMHTVVVLNSGGGAATIEDVGFRVVSEAFANLSVQQLRDSGETVDGPELPCRIDSHDHKSWDIEGVVMVGRLPDIGPMYAWAEQFVPVRGWPWPADRRIGRRLHRSGDTVPVPE